MRDEICIAYGVLMIYLVTSLSEMGILLYILLYIRTSDVLDEKIDRVSGRHPEKIIIIKNRAREEWRQWSVLSHGKIATRIINGTY
jgi:hypothetical protein